VSSNCSNTVLALKWDAAHPGPGGAPLPDTLFVKLPSAELLTRAFCNVLGIWRIECDFYRNLAPRVPIRVPRAYAVADRGTRFVLLLEDLHGATDVELFTNPDMLAGPSVERARQCLTTLASLHAAFWGRAPEERDSLLPLARHPFLSPRSRSLNLVLNESALGPCRRKAPELLTPDIGALFLRALAHWDALVESWYREPLTLIHGDSHLGNFFADGERMGMLDWQAAQWGKGIRDVQYFLIDSLPEDVLAANEEALLAHYLAELERNGVALERAEAWEQYRAYSFQTLMTIVVSLGLGALSESDEVMLAILARSVAAVRRLRFGDWLDDLVAARAT
jgi:hypothetical protein